MAFDPVLNVPTFAYSSQPCENPFIKLAPMNPAHDLVLDGPAAEGLQLFFEAQPLEQHAAAYSAAPLLSPRTLFYESAGLRDERKTYLTQSLPPPLHQSELPGWQWQTNFPSSSHIQPEETLQDIVAPARLSTFRFESQAPGAPDNWPEMEPSRHSSISAGEFSPQTPIDAPASRRYSYFSMSQSRRSADTQHLIHRQNPVLSALAKPSFAADQVYSPLNLSNLALQTPPVESTLPLPVTDNYLSSGEWMPAETLHGSVPSLTTPMTSYQAQSATAETSYERRSTFKPHFQHYLQNHNKLEAKEKVAFIFSAKIAQRSYNKEKRFLTPPPMALILNESSTTDVYCSFFAQESPETLTQAYQTDTHYDLPHCKGYAHRAYVVNQESDTRKAVPLISIKHGLRPKDGEPTFLRFLGPAAKTISKPAKKKAKAKLLEFHITHGSLVSIGNRHRTQAMSTRYLCSDETPDPVPCGESYNLTGTEASGVSTVQLAASTASDNVNNYTWDARPMSWDPFIIYLANPQQSSTIQRAGPPGFPPMPTIAMDFDGPDLHVIRGNQMVVLQCYKTGAVSPLLIMRDTTGTRASGWERSDGLTGEDLFCAAPGERIEQPISHLQKVAFEVVENIGNVFSAGRTSSSTFFSCTSPSVSVSRLPPTVRRTYAATHRQTSSSSEPSARASMQQTTAPSIPSALQFARPPHMRSLSNQMSQFGPQSFQRMRAASMSQSSSLDVSNAASAPRHRRGTTVAGSLGASLNQSQSRQSSVSYLPSYNERSPSQEPAQEAAEETASQRTYFIEVGQSCIWTISGVSLVKYRWLPSAQFAEDDRSLPLVEHVVSSTALEGNLCELSQDYDWIVLVGHSFRAEFQVWFDDVISPEVIFENDGIMFAALPTAPYTHARGIYLIDSTDTIFNTGFCLPMLATA